MKLRLPCLLLAAMLALSLTACGSDVVSPAQEREGMAPEELKVGLILSGDRDSANNQNHIQSLRTACRELGMNFDAQVVIQDEVVANQNCTKVANQLADEGCKIVFAAGYSHEGYLLAAADDWLRVQFCHAGGVHSALDNRRNSHDYYAKVYQAQYLAGVAAGMTTETDLLGFVGAYPNAHVISGYTAYYQGARSVNPEVRMLVSYINAWANPDLEAVKTQSLIDLGCDVISHHTDTTTALATAEANGVWGISYHQDTSGTAPNATLTTVRVNWEAYYIYAMGCLLEGEPIDQDWCGTYEQGACSLTPINADAGRAVQQAVELAEEGLGKDSLLIFSGPLYGVNADGGELALGNDQFFPENQKSSAPTFDYVVDGVTILP